MLLQVVVNRNCSEIQIGQSQKFSICIRLHKKINFIRIYQI
ncbi:protein of unknown function [Clostridium beijerinckii]|nr:protein of unknown function [Clostridium beijerinckii]